ncbi:NAD-binding protein [Stratiformator vulcanicus]|uniref:Potassium transporter peripheral membrane component n=1 Tax=Stratiformator vulcanicus TaxID=2527980 RepID=A0A517QZ26_9PLAN|nr:NAD-binding protein [Stratiformator vulcanicus]QDT36905.1 potassium transporter peripheral membrane component [Stratiformator vulcanicus]
MPNRSITSREAESALRPWHRYRGMLSRRFLTFLIALALALVVVTGTGFYVGHVKEYNAAWDNGDWGTLASLTSAMVYEIGQVFTLEMEDHLIDSDNSEKASDTPIKRKASPWYAVARFLAVVFVGILALKAILLLLRTVRRDAMRTSRRGHNVVCGIGRIGTAVIEEIRLDVLTWGDVFAQWWNPWRIGTGILTKLFGWIRSKIKRETPKDVVAIDSDVKRWNQRRVEDRDAIVLHADATDIRSLYRARVHKAARLFAVTGSDEANIEIVTDTYRLIEIEKRKLPKPLECYAHVSDPGLEQVLRSHLPSEEQSQLRTHTFNVFQIASRRLLIDHLLKHRPRGEEVALYIVIGFGQMGQTLVRYLSEQAHFENRKRARFLILTGESENSSATAAEVADAFLSRWGQFSPRAVADSWADIRRHFKSACDSWDCQDDRLDPHYRTGNPDAVEYAANAVFARLPKYPADLRFLHHLDKILSDPTVRPALMVCFDDDDRNFATAGELRLKLATFANVDAERLPIFASLPRQQALADFLDDIKQDVIPFGRCEDVATLDEITNSITERLALHIRANYKRERLRSREEEDAYRQKFFQDTADFRHSNLMAAEHAMVKLACLGYGWRRPGESLDGLPVVRTLEEPDRVLLAQMEHNRWLAERLLAGWRYGKGKDSQPRRISFCTWDKLSDQAQEQKKDLRQVDLVFDVLQSELFEMTIVKLNRAEDVSKQQTIDRAPIDAEQPSVTASG